MAKKRNDDEHELTYLERKRQAQSPGSPEVYTEPQRAPKETSARDDFFLDEETDEEFERKREERRMRAKKRRKRHLKFQITLIVLLILLIAALAASILYLPKYLHSRQANQKNSISVSSVDANTAADTQDNQTIVISDNADQQQADPVSDSDSADAQPATEAPAQQTVSDTTSGDAQDILAQADLLAAGYDYDGAIALINGSSDLSGNAEAQAAISRYETAKASCVAVDVTSVPHIFYHSLVNEPSYAFSAERLGQGAADGMNAWMTTVDEFDKITQQLYDNGYVYVRLRDLVNETVDDSGNVHFTPRTDLMLPEGKKAIVLSVDDLAYYHSYEAASFPDRLVLDDAGKVKCHYVKPDGTESVGDYDVVPRLNTFLEEHPDGAYHGARGLIALTGYNGVFGYRTDIDYQEKANLMNDQAAWLDAHPDFNRDDEIAQATVIADAIKAEGWEFASHTWGHLSVTSKTADQLLADNQKWVDNVQNIVGKTDTIIFAHGNDIGDWMPYSSDNEKFQALKNAGYNFYCNVDGSVPHWVQINDNCVRQGRIDLDGYMLYQASQGATTVIDNLITASAVFDSRRPTPVVANGEG